MDSDYEPPDYVQEEILHESPIFSRPTSTHLEKEEAMRRVLEIKINRYPLRHYLNLGTGLDVHLRPNYYESDQEEEDNRKRRHSMSTLRAQKEEEEENEPNLKKVRQRSFSEGAAIVCEKKKEDENDDIEEANTSLQDGGLNSDNEQDGLCITRTLTYTSKKQIIKLYRTEHLDVDAPQSKAVYKHICDLASKNELLKKGILNYKNKNYVSSEKQPDDLDSFDLPFSVRYSDGDDIQKEVGSLYGEPQIQREREDKNAQSYEEENDIYSESNEKSYFLSQLKLKSLPQGAFGESKNKNASDSEKFRKKCSFLPCETQVLVKKDKVTQTECCKSIKNKSFNDKYRKVTKDDIRNDKLSESKNLSRCNGKKVHDTFFKKEKNHFIRHKENPAKNINDEIKMSKDFCRNLDKTTLNCKTKDFGKGKTHFSHNGPLKYHEVIQRACENVFKPGMLPQKDSVSKRFGNELKNKKITEGTKPSSEFSSSENASGKETVNKEKMSFNWKSADHNIRPLYNIEDLERKLKSIFEEPENKTLLEGSQAETKLIKTTCLNQNGFGNYIVRKEKDKTKSTLQLLKKSKKQKYASKSAEKRKHSGKCSSTLSNDKMNIKKTRKTIKTFKEKRRALCEAKSILKKMWPRRVREKSPDLTLHSSGQETKECGSVCEEKQKAKDILIENTIENVGNELERQSNHENSDDQTDSGTVIHLREEESSVNVEQQIEYVGTERKEKTSTCKEVTVQNAVERGQSPKTVLDLPNGNSKSKCHNSNLDTEEQLFDDSLKTSEDTGKLKANSEEKTSKSIDDKSADTCPQILEEMFPYETEEDQALRDLIATLTDSIDADSSSSNCQDFKTKNNCKCECFFYVLTM